MTARGSMFERNRTELQHRLHRLGITYQQIGALAGVSTSTVYRCLHRHAHLGVRFGTVFAVRAEVMMLASRADPSLAGVDLFAEYHVELRREFAQLDTTQPGRQDAGPVAVH